MRIVFGLGKRGATSIPDEWATQMARRGHDVRVVSVEEQGGLRGFTSRLHSVLRDVQPDVVHLHHSIPALAGPIVRVMSPDSAVILTVHRLVTSMNNRTWLAHVLASPWPDALIANSGTTLDSFPRWLKRKQRCQVIHNGVDLNQLDAFRPASVPERGEVLKLISVGRLIPEKNFEGLLTGLSLLPRDLTKEWRLTIVGDGPRRETLIGLTRSLGLADRVEFVGALERSEVHSVLWAADAFVLCSRTEGFCNAVVEAMAAGLPVAVTPAGALPEVVGEAALKARGTGNAAIVEMLQGLLSMDAEGRATLGAQASHRVRQEFTMEHTLDAYEALYEDLV